MNESKERYIILLKNLEKYLIISKTLDVPNFIYSELKERIYIPETKPKKTEEKPIIKKSIQKELSENQICQRCKNKLFAVQFYFKKPEVEPKKIMVLNYNGSLNPKNISKDNSHKYYFSSLEEDEIFNRMLSKINLNLKQLYFMEFVACYFPSNSTQEEWVERVNNCYSFLNKNIIENQIERIIVTGNSAILLFGEEAKQLANKSSIINLPINNQTIPTLVIRSPLAILTLETKRKEYEKKLKNFPLEFKAFQEKKDLHLLKEDIVNSIKVQTSPKVINNIKLISASQVKSEKEIEKDILNKLGEGKYILYKAISYRLEEIKIKQQMLNALEKLAR